LAAADAGEEPTLAMILRRRELWGLSLAQFCATYTLYLVLSWLPVYLVKTHGFSMAQMAPIGAGVDALSAGTSVVTGWASDRWVRAGAVGGRLRMGAFIAGLAVVTGCLIACAQADTVGAVLAMAGCGVGIGIYTPALFASVQTLAGAHATGRWMGIQNCLGNVAGITAPIVTGMVVDRTGHFASAFVIASLLAVVGILALVLIVRRIDPIDWSAPVPTRMLPAVPPVQG
jgi:sugar phosphate permease